MIDHPVLGKIHDRPVIQFTFDGKLYEGYEDDTIASALLANGIRNLRVHEENGTPRGIYCNIGHCFECRVTVDGNSGIRACMTKLKNGMKVESGKLQPSPLNPTIEARELPRTYAEFVSKQKGNNQGGDLDV